MTKPSGTPPPYDLLHRQAIAALQAGQLQEGLRLLKLALQGHPRPGLVHADYGAACHQAGDAAAAEKHFRLALDALPRNAYVMNHYGAFLLQRRRFDEADKILTAAHAAEPANFEVTNNLGMLRHFQQRPAEAEEMFRRSIAANPRWGASHANLANMLRDAGQPDRAYPVYCKAVQLDPRNAAAWRGLGQVAFFFGRAEEGIDALKKSLQLDPRFEKNWVFLLSALEKSNRADDMASLLERALQRFPNSAGVTLYQARLLRRQKNYQAAIDALERLLPAAQAAETQDAASRKLYLDYLFDLGMLYDRLDDADKAFAYLKRANDLEAAGPPWNRLDRHLISCEIENLLPALSLENLPATAAAPIDNAASRLVFLVGFPRSGTTLLDQILSSHPQVTVAEEKPAVAAMVRYILQKHGKTIDANGDAGYAAVMENIDPAELAEMRRLFFDEHGPAAEQGGGQVFVDKLPLNILHAGLIRRVFPAAKFILALRHPCDAVLSCFMQRFTANAAMARFLDLADAAAFYDEAFTLWDRLQSTFAITAHETRYEDVVADFRPTVAALLEALSLPWNDAVMEYDKTAKERGRINTPSYHQVTEKIYTRASGRWLKYRQYLMPHWPRLATHAARYGYTAGED